MELVYILFSVLLVSAISLLGAISLLFNKGIVRKGMPWIVAFAAGSLLGVSFFDLIPESVEHLPDSYMIYILVGILGFLLFEQVIHWHHEHGDNCSEHDNARVHATGYLVALGDGIHNFLDGVLIASTFLINPALGWSTTLSIILHEIPQEISDFGVLLHSGFKAKQAILVNLLSALSAVVGGLVGYLFLSRIESAIPYAIAIGAGGFIYISLVDLFAEVRSGKGIVGRISRILMVILGIAVMWLVISNFGHEG